MGLFNHSGNDSEESLLACDNCKQLFPKSKLRRCKKCGAILCSKCQKTHVCLQPGIPKEEPRDTILRNSIPKNEVSNNDNIPSISQSPATLYEESDTRKTENVTVFHFTNFDYDAYLEHINTIGNLGTAFGNSMDEGDLQTAIEIDKTLFNLNSAEPASRAHIWAAHALVVARIEESENGKIEQGKELFKKALVLDTFFNELLDMELTFFGLPLTSPLFDSLIKAEKSTIDTTKEYFGSRNISIPQTVFSKKVNLNVNLKLPIKEDIEYITQNLYLILGLAENGDRYSQEFLSFCYLGGYVVDKNIQKGFYWLEKAYNSGAGKQYDPTFVDGFGLMGKNYELGATVKKDITKALTWYKRGIENNSPLSMYFLANLYYDGVYVSKDIDKALTLYIKSAELGSTDAECKLGSLYYIGKDVKQDLAKAFNYWTNAAKQEHPLSLSNLGEFYRDVQGDTQNVAYAVELFRKAANYSNPNGMNNLGKSYLNGIGVIQDYDEGFKWFVKAGEIADNTSSILTETQYWIGYCYYNGLGVVKSKIKAREWIEKSLLGNNEEALAFAESHPDLNIGNISGNISTTYQISGDYIHNNHGIIAKDEAIVNRAHLTKDAVLATENAINNKTTVSSVISIEDSEIDNDFSLDDELNDDLSETSDSPSVDNAQITRNNESIFHIMDDDFDAKAYDAKLDNLAALCKSARLKMEAGRCSEALSELKVILNQNPAEALLKLMALFTTAGLSAYLESHEKGVSYLKEALTLEIFVDDIVPLTTDVSNLDQTYDEMLSIKDKAIYFFKKEGISIPQTVFSNQIDPRIYLNLIPDVNPYDAKRYGEIHHLYETLGFAENGDRLAQEILAVSYFFGVCVEKNIKKGLYWLEKSCNSGTGNSFMPESMVISLMARNYQFGITVDKDISKAISWYEKGVKNNNAASMRSLAVIYYSGQDTPKDLNKAISLFTKAAELGDADAQCDIGFLYYANKEVKQDLSKAFYWWTKASEQEHPLALSNLGSMYEEGEGVPPNITRAIELYRKSASYSNPLGMNNLGQCYLEGNGVVQDYNEGFNWFLKASETAEEDSFELAVSQYWIGYCYYNGFGVVKSKIKAREWIEKAIQGNNEDALTFAEEHPDLNLGNISGNISTTYQISGDFIRDNHGIIANDEAIVNRAHIAKDAVSATEDAIINKTTVSSATFIDDSKSRFCPECGKPVDEDAKFCKYCGRKLA